MSRLRDAPTRSGAGRSPCRVTNSNTRSEWRSSDRRRRGAAQPLPPGADPGEEDGQGPDLLAGDLGLHEHQRDPDPARPLGVRQVRQARRRLQHRLAARRDPQDPPDSRAAQHRARRGRPPGRGDRGRRSSRSTGSTSPRSSTRIRKGRGGRSARSASATTASCATSSATRTSSWACSRCLRRAAQKAAQDLVDSGVKIIFNYSEALLDVPPTSRSTRRTPRSSCSTRSTST